jgi:hypothetical protein
VLREQRRQHQQLQTEQFHVPQIIYGL